MKVFRKRVQEYRYTIKLSGVWFEAFDLLETCNEIDMEADIYLTDQKMIDALTKAKLLRSPGSGRWESRATGTDKLKGFTKRLNSAIDGAETLSKKEYGELK